MCESLVGTWTLRDSDNFEAFLSAIGCNYLLRKAAIVIKPNLIIAKENDDKWSIRVRSTFKNSDTVFKLGEDLEETTIDGRHIKSMFQIEEGSKLVNEQKDFKTGKVQCVGIRQIVDGKLTEYLTAGDVKSTRTYVKVE